MPLLPLDFCLSRTGADAGPLSTRSLFGGRPSREGTCPPSSPSFHIPAGAPSLLCFCLSSSSPSHPLSRHTVWLTPETRTLVPTRAQRSGGPFRRKRALVASSIRSRLTLGLLPWRSLNCCCCSLFFHRLSYRPVSSPLITTASRSTRRLDQPLSFRRRANEKKVTKSV
jgi:hypothetical protein